eukprot:CAMPEP_0197643852 /NCGR_PEP_ID=MMETSP1338-20131121/17023_1 /TAXON_ID=43686 ORGANISM="Pelagodinium beii, Strain RCC1491" /NCGR_SAMPLE_ID=MMETSP1338 /ASSEMBLY_ACC=CAM_ASM_000754 /LENGTH=269 /DNA_ID=CAMNT_0043217143 /DNA_START=1 /DNA_END=807 /DNA_ORIENTATION=-
MSTPDGDANGNLSSYIRLGKTAGRWERYYRSCICAGAAFLFLLVVAYVLTGLPLGLLAAPEKLDEVLDACVVNIFLVRHCDKNPPWAKDPTPFELCTREGLLRGEHLAEAFGPGGRFPVPSRLYARKLDSGYYSSRDLYLLWPLAQRLQLLVNASFAVDDMPALAQSLLEVRDATCSEGRAATMLVSWDHCCIPALAQALGCQEQICKTCWDDGDFDTMLQLRYVKSSLSDQDGTQSWNVSVRSVSEGFAGPQRAIGYQECIENPAESN